MKSKSLIAPKVILDWLMDLQLTKDGLKCALIGTGRLCVAVVLELRRVELPVHNLDIKDMVIESQTPKPS